MMRLKTNRGQVKLFDGTEVIILLCPYLACKKEIVSIVRVVSILVLAILNLNPSPHFKAIK